MEIGVVEWVDIGPQAFAQGPGQIALVVNPGNRGQLRMQRLQPLGFNRRLVHVGVVQVGNFARFDPAGALALAAS